MAAAGLELPEFVAGALIESMQKFHHYYGDDFRIECPTGSGNFVSINEAADEVAFLLLGQGAGRHRRVRRAAHQAPQDVLTVAVHDGEEQGEGGDQGQVAVLEDQPKGPLRGRLLGGRRGLGRGAGDLAAIESLRDATGARLFPRAVFAPINAPDPDAPPEWDLRSVDAKAYWTVQECAFTPPDLRKQAAIQRVRELRAAGFQAYYYHGTTISSVCIGLWPKEAVNFPEEDQVGVSERHMNDPSYRLIVDTVGMSPDDLQKQLKGQRNVGVVRAVQDIKDESLRQMAIDFPHHVNYEPEFLEFIDEKNQTITIPKPGIIVKVPHDQPGEGAANAPPPDTRLIDPNAGGNGINDLRSRLRSIGQ
jgi:hypothetical protein